jgi:hypothetical protein
MAKRRNHRASEAQDGRSERPATGHGQPRAARQPAVPSLTRLGFLAARQPAVPSLTRLGFLTERRGNPRSHRLRDWASWRSGAATRDPIAYAIGLPDGAAGRPAVPIAYAIGLPGQPSCPVALGACWKRVSRRRFPRRLTAPMVGRAGATARRPAASGDLLPRRTMRVGPDSILGRRVAGCFAARGAKRRSVGRRVKAAPQGVEPSPHAYSVGPSLRLPRRIGTCRSARGDSVSLRRSSPCPPPRIR